MLRLVQIISSNGLEGHENHWVIGNLCAMHKPQIVSSHKSYGPDMKVGAQCYIDDDDQ